MNSLLHIVPGRFIANLLREGFEFDKHLRGEIVDLNDDLRLGPIKDLHTEDGRDIRINFLRSLYPQSTEPILCDCERNGDFRKINQLKNELLNEKEIIVWAGHNTKDILFLARLLYELKPEPNRLKIVAAPENPIFTNGRWHRPDALYFGGKVIAEIGKFVRSLSEIEVFHYSSLWNNITASPLLIRATEHNVLMNREITHFDSTLLQFCTTELQNPARVVGKTLNDTNSDVSDLFLNWRLHELVRAGKLEAKGELRHMREYEVRLPQE